MNKMALILVLGLNLVVSQVFAQAEDEVVYEEDGVEYVEDGVEYEDEYADEGVVEEDEGVVDDGVVDDGTYEDDAYDTQTNARKNDSVDATDITRWTDSKEDIARKQARAKRKAEQEAEYNQSIKRRRSGLFLGVGVGYSASKLSNAFKSLPSNMGGLGLFIGYQHAFNEYSGLRVYGEGNSIINMAACQENSKCVNVYGRALANLDFYLEGNMGRNYTETLGFFFGLGAGYVANSIYNITKHTTSFTPLWALNVNYGVHTILGTHHRLELYGRTNTMYTYSGGALDIWLRYSYMF